MAEGDTEEVAKRADDYFRDYSPDFDRDLYRVAAAIGAGRVPSGAEIAAVRPKIDRRAKDDINLLFFAEWSATQVKLGSPAYHAMLETVDKLLGAGASPYIHDYPNNPRETFISFATSAAGPEAQAGTDLTRLYLKHGGDPNYVDNNPRFDNDPAFVNTHYALNFETFKLLIDAGANIFVRGIKGSGALGGKSDMMLVATNVAYTCDIAQNSQYIDYVIDKGLLKGATPEQFDRLIADESSYMLRDDAWSREIVRVTRKIMKATGSDGGAAGAKVLAFAKERGW